MNEQSSSLNAFLKNVLVKDVMTSPIRTVNIFTDFSSVQEIFVNERFRHLPIVDQHNKLMGIISQRDVYRAIAPHRFVDGSLYYREGIIVDQDGYYEKESLDKYILNNVMHKDPKTIQANQSMADVLPIMVKYKLGCITVVDDQHHVLGIITRFDILKFFEKFC